MPGDARRRAAAPWIVFWGPGVVHGTAAALLYPRAVPIPARSLRDPVAGVRSRLPRRARERDAAAAVRARRLGGGPAAVGSRLLRSQPGLSDRCLLSARRGRVSPDGVQRRDTGLRGLRRRLVRGVPRPPRHGSVSASLRPPPAPRAPRRTPRAPLGLRSMEGEPGEGQPRDAAHRDPRLARGADLQ